MWHDNELAAAERDESRSARYGVSEMQRAASGCRHGRLDRFGSCVECGEDPT